MSFITKHNQTTKKINLSTELKLWLNTLFFSSLILLGLSLYLFFRRGNYNLYIANKAIASTSFILIGLSFTLSELCYFWKFLDLKIIYRKHLGLVGFGLVLLHIIVTLFFLNDVFSFPSYYLGEIRIFLAFSFGVLALIIFVIMASISNRYAILKLGGKSWKSIMQVGYVAYVFVILHFALIKYKGWVKWLLSLKPLLPPLSLLAVIFGLVIVILPMVLWRFKKHTLRTEA